MASPTGTGLVGRHSLQAHARFGFAELSISRPTAEARYRDSGRDCKNIEESVYQTQLLDGLKSANF